MADLETRSFRRFLRLRPRNFTFSPCAAWIQEKYKHLSGHWQYVYNGLPKDAYSFNVRPFANDAPLVIICRIGEGKGVTDAIEIAQKTGRKLIIAGKVGDYPHEKEWFAQKIKKYCDGLNIRFVGEVSDAEKQHLLENAAGLLMLSAGSEAFNLTMIEANACGCPVLTYDRYFGPDFIKPGINGFVGSTQQDLIGAVGRLASIDRAGCRRDFEENYTAQRMTANYLKLYHSTV
jgi:glycosyltransferase involved in cell wall biosynthesis